MTTRLIYSSILAVAGLSACAPHSMTGSADPLAGIASLEAYHWQLDRAVDTHGNHDSQWIRKNHKAEPVTLTFDTQRLAVAGLCNSMGASYNADGSKIHISQTVSTMMMCPDESLMRYEQAVGQQLEQASAWHITRVNDGPVDPPSLTLHFKDGSQWVLNGIPTAKTKYGSTGETIFLEVAAQRVPCAHPLIPDYKCLKVRTVNYDTAGLKQGHGEWEFFYDEIDNYEHIPGERNVLRVKRYTRQNVPADASQYAYVLDLIVERDQSGE